VKETTKQERNKWKNEERGEKREKAIEK